ncbi:MAG: hypothetical protein U5L09_16205 [Bacteroidales bacterium]|nr:hypothetical protein [Bacteroidales bacterium]
MKSNLLQFMDFEKVDTLLEGFNKTTGFVTAIIDLEWKCVIQIRVEANLYGISSRSSRHRSKM